MARAVLADQIMPSRVLATSVRRRSNRLLLLLVLMCALTCKGVTFGDEVRPTEPLTNAAQVHAVSPELAGQSLPVHLEGVITHFNHGASGFFFQDQTDGIYVQIVGRGWAAQVGDRVRIEGETDAGAYAPVIRLRELKNLGRGELPKPGGRDRDRFGDGKVRFKMGRSPRHRTFRRACIAHGASDPVGSVAL